MPVLYDSQEPFVQTLSGQITTTDNTATAIISFTIPTNSTASIVTNVAAIRDNLAESAGYYRHTVIRRTAAGGLGLIGETDVSDLEDVGGWDLNVVVNGDQIEVRVTGAAGSTITWRAVSKIMSISL